MLANRCRFKTDWTDARMQAAHLAGMREQLLQLRAAVALALALNRTLIMPKASG